MQWHVPLHPFNCLWLALDLFKWKVRKGGVAAPVVCRDNADALKPILLHSNETQFRMSYAMCLRASYDVNNTKKHDEDAMRYLSYALYPLVAGYAIYSLMYKSHKSW